MMTSQMPLEEREGDYWHKKWDKNQIGFHINRVDKILMEHIDLLTGGRENVSVFVSLSGKSHDLKWLAEQGHDVTGLEFSDFAIKTFFEEQHIDYTVSPVENLENGTVYKAKDYKLKIYCCDFFEFSSSIAGQFDAVWDRHGFGAMLPHRWTQYRDILMSLMKPGANCLMLTAHYDPSVMEGPPMNVPTELIQEYFGDRCVIEKIAQRDWLTDRFIAVGHKWIEMLVHHLVCKQ